jgi:gliding-associated putative ABC transporter substrate-binding component GldG
MQNRRWEDILSFSALALLLVWFNLLSSEWRYRLDLTEEKRYTLSEATQHLLGSLDEVVYVEVYLEGELNPGFRRLQEAIRETLEEFRIHAGARLQYRFIDPEAVTTPQNRQAFYEQLVAKGIPATNVFDRDEGKRTEKLIFPGALVSYRNRETGVLLLKGNTSSSAQEQLNQSVEGVEYHLASAIQKLASREKKSIAFIEGQDELHPEETADMTAALSEYYYVDRVSLNEAPLDRYAALIVAQPKKRFTEEEKYRLDQYIMGGGKALFLLDKIQLTLDSIGQGGTYAFAYDLNLEEILFKYGVRLNSDLIQDRQQPGIIELYMGQFGDRAQIQPYPWPYYMYLNRFGEHPVVRNLDLILTRFASTNDTVAAPGIRKTPLMFTSQYTRVRPMPNLVELNEIRQEMDYSFFDQSFLPVAYLLEGEFSSLYALRFPPPGINPTDVKKSSPSTKIIVVSDGDVFRQEIDPRSGERLPLTYDRFRKQDLSNKDFILNALSYLTDENGLILSRKKQVTLRLLDRKRLDEERQWWQTVNLGLPVLLTLGLGLGLRALRKRKFAKK